MTSFASLVSNLSTILYFIFMCNCIMFYQCQPSSRALYVIFPRLFVWFLYVKKLEWWYKCILQSRNTVLNIAELSFLLSSKLILNLKDLCTNNQYSRYCILMQQNTDHLFTSFWNIWDLMIVGNITIYVPIRACTWSVANSPMWIIENDPDDFLTG